VLSISDYYDGELIQRLVDEGAHRAVVGWQWDEIGASQLELLRANGLQRRHKLLDIGCGSLRGGIHFIRFLEAGNYFGTDLNQSLLDAGYERELKALDLQGRLPRANLMCDGSFEFERFGQAFDFALAYSLFTHLTLNHIRICLEKLIPAMKPGATFIATYFEVPDSQPLHRSFLQYRPGGISHGIEDPYHYRFDDFTWLAERHGCTLERVGDFELRRNQKILKFDMPVRRANG